jgi:hypothetical protein
MTTSPLSLRGGNFREETSMCNNRGGAAPALLILLAGLVVAAANILLYVDTVQPLATTPNLGSLIQALHQALAQHPIHVVSFVAVPMIAAILVATVLTLTQDRTARPAPVSPESEQVAPPKVGEEAVLRLLAGLQKEGRFIDFLGENLAQYDDAQVGAAVRPIHEGCRQALRERITIERIYDRDEGSEVEVAAGFDPAAVRLTGNVKGEPPFRGTLQHSGWRATKVDLPATSGDLDPTVLAPAEVELP